MALCFVVFFVFSFKPKQAIHKSLNNKIQSLAKLSTQQNSETKIITKNLPELFTQLSWATHLAQSRSRRCSRLRYGSFSCCSNNNATVGKICKVSEYNHKLHAATKDGFNMLQQQSSRAQQNKKDCSLLQLLLQFLHSQPNSFRHNCFVPASEAAEQIPKCQQLYVCTNLASSHVVRLCY